MDGKSDSVHVSSGKKVKVSNKNIHVIITVRKIKSLRKEILSSNSNKLDS